MAKNRDDIPGMQKQHEITNPATGETRTITQQEWKDTGKQLRDEGWERLDEEGEMDEEMPEAEGGDTVGA